MEFKQSEDIVKVTFFFFPTSRCMRDGSFYLYGQFYKSPLDRKYESYRLGHCSSVVENWFSLAERWFMDRNLLLAKS